MSLTRQQIRALRKRQLAAEATAALDYQERVAGPLMDLSAEMLPPLAVCGWAERGHVGGGLLHCVTCSPQQPTPNHTAVYETSLYATRPCAICGRCLNHAPD